MKQITRIANNYNPLPVNIIKGKDVFLWDIYKKNMSIYWLDIVRLIRVILIQNWCPLCKNNVKI